MVSQNLSSAESYTWEIIQEHYEEIPKVSISELADMAHVSISTVNRTVRKKGFAGYADFRFSIKEKSLPQNNKFSKEVLVAISKNEEELLKTLNGISAESIEEAVKAIDAAEEIILFARGLSINAATEMMKKLQLYHKFVTLYDESRVMEYYAKFAKSESLIVAVSLFGETEEILRAVKIAQSKGAKVLSLTASGNSRLVAMSDISLVGYKSRLEVNYFSLDVHSRLPIYILVRILFDSYSIYKHNKAESPFLMS